MSKMNLFTSETNKNYTAIDLPNAEILYVPSFFTSEEADTYFKHLKKETEWQEDDIKIFGKVYKQPRLTALYGNLNKSYSYSGITMFPKPFTPILKEIKTKVETFCNATFTTVLLNLYRDGKDSNGWHSDNEKELGINPIIASISFGEERDFHFRNIENKKIKNKIKLAPGSLLLMKGETQHYWQHQLPKTKKNIGARINLTFRTII